jgi:hypothetical protein
MKNLLGFVRLLWLIAALPVFGWAQANAGFPLVIVVHGIGGGNADPGWSREYADAWGVETHEVTFRYKDRDTITSLRDFVPEAGDWALSVQKQIKDIVRQNPGRRVMIVSHSWGTVVTKMALEGGTGDGISDELKQQGYHIDPIQPADFQVEEWVTLGSPLGEAGTPELGGGITKRRLDVPADRPSIVKHWTNFCDLSDWVCSKSRNLPGAENVELKSGKNPLSAHTGVWTDPEVRKHIWNQALRISSLPKLAATRVGDVTGPAVDRSKTPSDEAIVAEYRSLLPAVLQKNKKPWHTRINIIANAEKQAQGYHVNYQTYCLIENGPDQGKDYVCAEFETVLDLSGIKSAVADMKRQLGK